MKVALLIAGYLRNYEANLEYIKEQIIDKYKNVDVFLHITTDENSEDKYFNQIEESDIDMVTSVLNPITTIIEGNTHYNENKQANNVINHWNKLFKLNELKKINEDSSGVMYDLVIRYRPDLSIRTKDIFDMATENKIYIPKDSKIDRVKLTSQTDGYLCDALAFGSSEMMDWYFNIYNSLPELIEDHGPVSETVLYEYLNSYGDVYRLIDIDYSFILSKCNVFAICGDSGSGKSTLSNILKNTFTDSFKLECDRYHKWERGNENWDNVTHLNPNANYITKMKEDIFNLKVGNEIYQVDYDHYTGKFTEKQLINPANNLIVCGLHSLYSDDSTIYNLKIYMDTDENLKKKWKITRDVKERGYSMDKVLATMKKRESDFNEFIDPQKENADLIVRFFSTEDIDLNDLDKENKISLQLSIGSNFNVTDILKRFDEYGVEYSIGGGPKFINVTFYDYKYVDILNGCSAPATGDFYDYILYFILNLSLTS